MVILVILLEFAYLFGILFAGFSRDLFWFFAVLPIVVGLVMNFTIRNAFLKALGNGLLIGGIVYAVLILIYIIRHPYLLQ